MANGDEQNGNMFKGRTLTYRQKMFLGFAAPIAVLVLGWIGTWVGSTVTQGASANTRLSVAETKITTLESQRAELLGLVREIKDDVKRIDEKIDNLPLLASKVPDLPQRIVRMERKIDDLARPDNISTSDRTRSTARDIPYVCDEPSVWVKAANGEWFCRRR